MTVKHVKPINNDYVSNTFRSEVIHRANFNGIFYARSRIMMKDYIDVDDFIVWFSVPCTFLSLLVY